MACARGKCQFVGASQVARMVKNMPANAGDVRGAGSIPGSRRSWLEEGMATHCSTLAWTIPWSKKPGGLQSIGSQRDGHDWSVLSMHASPQTNKQPTNPDKLMVFTPSRKPVLHPWWFSLWKFHELPPGQTLRVAGWDSTWVVTLQDAFFLFLYLHHRGSWDSPQREASDTKRSHWLSSLDRGLWGEAIPRWGVFTLRRIKAVGGFLPGLSGWFWGNQTMQKSLFTGS